MTGNILGAYGGVSAIPPEWLKTVELREVIEEMADDLLCGGADTREWGEKYPGP